jgi:hypothetical protein
MYEEKRGGDRLASKVWGQEIRYCHDLRCNTRILYANVT